MPNHFSSTGFLAAPGAGSLRDIGRAMLDADRLIGDAEGASMYALGRVDTDFVNSYLASCLVMAEQGRGEG